MRPRARPQWRVWISAAVVMQLARLCQWCVITMTQGRPFPASCPLLSGAELEATPIGGDLEPQRESSSKYVGAFGAHCNPARVRLVLDLAHRRPCRQPPSRHGPREIERSATPSPADATSLRRACLAARHAFDADDAAVVRTMAARSEPPHCTTARGCRRACDRSRRCAADERNARRGAFTTCLRHFVDFRGLRPLQYGWAPPSRCTTPAPRADTQQQRPQQKLDCEVFSAERSSRGERIRSSDNEPSSKGGASRAPQENG